MGLKGIFKKQPGGTPLGNLVRSVGDAYTGGLVSKILVQGGRKNQKNADAEPVQKDIAINATFDTPTSDAESKKKTQNMIIAGVAILVTGVLIFVGLKKKK